MAREVCVTIGNDKYKTTVTIEPSHVLIADEPQDVGGTDQGPAPSEFFLTALGSCKVITMRMYADRKSWPLETATVNLSMESLPSELQVTTYIKCHIDLQGKLSEEQRNRLLKIAEKCPIHKILSNPIVIESNLV
ncbi:OsmC family protein [Sphingobacterium shayense]|uniref:OsmC family protein n=1 Tax=Sphingobacterium shayense TaxID=626343 RepID=UPI0015553014|nr:OsmC family protein [Sphingobacterium shayense]NQD71922.1 OsmC family protein [Sphingobacterium shayense]